MSNRLIRITSNYFCAGIDDGRPAPIIRYMHDWSIGRIAQYCTEKGWQFELLEDNNKNMAERIRGTIRKSNNRQWNGKTFHSINVDDVWYSVGLKKPPADGTLVEFEAEQNAKGYWDVTRAGLRVIQADAPTQGVSSAAIKASNKGMSKDDYWNRKEERDIEKDKRIERQSCRNSALALIEILVKTESLKLPAAAKRVQFLEELVDHYTELFLEQNYNKKSDEKNDEQSDEVSEEPNDDQATDQGDWNV